MSESMGELPVTIVSAELPRPVRYVWAAEDRVLVMASWLDAAGRVSAIGEWCLGGRGPGTDVEDGIDSTRHAAPAATRADAN